MSDIKVDFGGVSTATADISTGANAISAALDAMDSQLQPLRQAWTGEASQAYEVAKSKWNSALSDMKALLTDIGSAVDQGGQDYQQTEKNNTNRW